MCENEYVSEWFNFFLNFLKFKFQTRGKNLSNNDIFKQNLSIVVCGLWYIAIVSYSFSYTQFKVRQDIIDNL